MSKPAERPLLGTTVLDVSRMLPGAITARMLLDLGARLIKVEAPGSGDPMRSAEPRVGGTGAAFGALYRGAESICLDLRQPRDARALRAIAGHTDVMLESFRPGTLEAWGAGPRALLSRHPRLVLCSLTSFGVEGPASDRVAHDINLVASSGLLSLLPGEGMPGVQIADVAGGMLATSAILAALLGRASSGRGGWIDQPLSAGCSPFLFVARTERAAGGGGIADTLLGGACPAYRLYACADGKRLAIGALEPKFWETFVELLDLPELTGTGLDPHSPAGKRLEQKLATRQRADWLALFEQHALPITAVLELGDTVQEPEPFLPSFAVTTQGRAPHLGEHTAAILDKFVSGDL